MIINVTALGAFGKRDLTVDQETTIHELKEQLSLDSSIVASGKGGAVLLDSDTVGTNTRITFAASTKGGSQADMLVTLANRFKVATVSLDTLQFGTTEDHKELRNATPYEAKMVFIPAGMSVNVGDIVLMANSADNIGRVVTIEDLPVLNVPNKISVEPFIAAVISVVDADVTAQKWNDTVNAKVADAKAIINEAIRKDMLGEISENLDGVSTLSIDDID